MIDENNLSSLTIEEGHDVILVEAAAIANHDARLPPEAGHGEIFKPAPLESKLGGMCLSWKDTYRLLESRMFDQNLPPERFDEICATMVEISREATAKAMRDNAEILVQMIIVDAREGKNYFDRFENGSVS